ncbi:unnamed protein product, partial [Tuber aestivum]
MFPPGSGNDVLNVGSKYVISMYGTNEVFTAEGQDVRLREYQEGKGSQIWICEMNPERRFGMRNSATWRLLGRTGQYDQFGCKATDQRGWECLTFNRLSLGGYSLMMINSSSNRLHPVQRIDNKSFSRYLKIGGQTHQLGLHQLKDTVFRRFEWVIPHRLARSSAPFYDGEDSDQMINENSIEFLVSHGIRNIISLNSSELPQRQRGRFRAANIAYLQIKISEATAPTQEQFDQIRNSYDTGKTTLVYCGYGDGRTGTAISALQLFQGRALSHNDYRANRVQDPSQLRALDALSERIHGRVSISSGQSLIAYA